MLLAADVGGTKTALGIYSVTGGVLRRKRFAVVKSQEQSSFESLAARFVAEGQEKLDACAVGVAGPVVDGRSGKVNLPWVVDAKRTAKALRIRRVQVLNDLEATAWAIPHLARTKLTSLTEGVRARPGNAAVIAAGTGLGMAILFWDGEKHVPSATEGGHQGFSPRDERELELMLRLVRRFGRVSVERIVSGPGISEIFAYLAEGSDGVTAALRKRMTEADPNVAITQAALAGTDPVANETLDLFVSLYGAAAGDLALVARATAGVYLAGGISPKILPRLRSGAFVDAFRAKGRLSSFVSAIPIRVILDPDAALLGAAACAARAGRN